jgi:predicted glycosyltransferase
MKNELAIMGVTGDTKILWDADNKDEVDNARETFNRLKKKGYLAYTVKGKNGDKGEILKEFDPDVERIIMAPAPTGG